MNLTTKLERQIMELSSMIDGINIGLERARELREKLLLSGQQETLGLDALIEILRKDKAEIKAAMKELQRRLPKIPEPW